MNEGPDFTFSIRFADRPDARKFMKWLETECGFSDSDFEITNNYPVVRVYAEMHEVFIKIVEHVVMKYIGVQYIKYTAHNPGKKADYV